MLIHLLSFPVCIKQRPGVKTEGEITKENSLQFQSILDVQTHFNLLGYSLQNPALQGRIKAPITPIVL